ncbi:MAG: hypothetical protein NTY98_30625 [Verrucomicrobia bacterium]|nr:hypothetical protein [Verrucomicrobiota bacterium]
MRSAFCLGIASLLLTACLNSRKAQIGPSAPYHDIDPVAPEEYSRRYLEYMATTSWRNADDKRVLVCGALGTAFLDPGVTIEAALHRVRLQQPAFYNIAVWRPKDAAFHGVKFAGSKQTEPSVRVLSPFAQLSAGDVVIVLAKMVSF